MSSTVPDAAAPDPNPPGAGVTRGRHRATLEESHWTMPLVALGILSIVLGVLVLAWPGVTLLVVAITFGLELVVAGALRISTSRLLPTEAA